MAASANNLQVCTGDVGNAFLHGKTRERVFIIAGPEFGELAGIPLNIQGGLYGLRSSSARFHEHLSVKIRAMGYKPTKADPYLWMKEFETHNEYIATYVDDVLSFSKEPMKVIKAFEKDYVTKAIGKPRYYLGGDILDVPPHISTDTVQTMLSAHTYITRIVEKFEKLLGCCFKTRQTPMDALYHPELEATPLLSPDMHTKYRGLIGSANWMITLGRFDIAYAVNTLARYSMAPRQGHFDAMLRVFGYVKQNPDGCIIIDPSIPAPPTHSSEQHNWTE